MSTSDSIKLPKIAKCPKCGRKAKLLRSPDPAEMEKRYFVSCAGRECKFKTKIYGNTKLSAINSWNVKVSRVLTGKLPSDLRGSNGLT